MACASETHVSGLLIGAMIALICGCSSGYRGSVGDEASPGSDMTVTAEAFLFDSRIYRDGKPTTFRMEIYVTDTLIGLAGTGYFGKGAFRGRATADSVELYFPQSNEYMQEAVDDLVFSTPCHGVMPRLGLTTLLTDLPTDSSLGPSAVIETTESGDRRREFAIGWRDCPWRFELVYDLRDTGWRLRRLRFDNGGSFQLRAERDRHKADTPVKVRKFLARIPTDAVRIEP